MMLEKNFDNEQIPNLLYSTDVLRDIVYEYSDTLPFTAKLHLDEIVEYARSTGREIFKHITLAHFTKNKTVMGCIDDYNATIWGREIDKKYDEWEFLVLDIMEDYIEDNPSVTKVEIKELFRYAKWSGKEEYQNLEYSVLTDEYILDRIEEFNDMLSYHRDNK